MPAFEVTKVATFDDFVKAWDEADETTLRMLWQLLGDLDQDELLVKLPDWLAEEKVGYREGGTPTVFVGSIDDETEKAIRLGEATAAKPLAQLSHRIAHLAEGVENAEEDNQRREWLENRLTEKQRAFDTREVGIGLRDEWVPKSQVSCAIRRG